MDGSFNPNPSNTVSAVAVQKDGKILVGGWFTGIGSYSRSYIARVNADGSVDTAFNSNPNSPVRSISLHADGKIVMGGDFYGMGGIPQQYAARLYPDGALDASFNVSPNQAVESVAIQPDGKVLLSGYFTTVSSATRNYVTRVSTTDAALQSLMVADDGSRITWQRGGASPEVDWVTFERSSDAITWDLLGFGTRSSDGWQLGGQSLETGQSFLIRARGMARGGDSHSSSIVESIKFAYLPPASPVAAAATQVTGASFTANWSAAGTATGYLLDVATDSAFANCLPGYQNLKTGNTWSYPVMIPRAGTTYYYRVRAYNSGAASAPSSSMTVTVAGVPGAPTGVVASAGLGRAVVNFSAPLSDGGSAISSYTVTSSPGNASASGSSSPISVAGLAEGVAYTFTVTAVNSAGTGAASQPSAPIVIDSLAPVTTANKAGTYSAPQKVALSCNDGAGSGCSATFYCLGAGCTPLEPYEAGIAIADSTVLRFYSTDVSGNNEAVNTVPFTILAPVSIRRNTDLYYLTIQSAYDDALDGETVRLLGVDFTEDLIFTKGKAVALSGGFNQPYSAQDGATVLNGTLRLLDGVVRLDGLVIR